jgi:ubiquinone/menaquinone biosynthesis C-methylase UbiE
MKLETLQSCDLCHSDHIASYDAESNICRCCSCGYIFDNPRPTMEEIERFYSTPGRYDSWVDNERARDWMWKKRVRKMAKARTPGSLLDVGTGIGQFLHHARPYYSSVHGTEVSSVAIDIAMRKYGLRVSRGEIQSLELPDAPFDNISLFHVLEHVPSPKSVIERCWELMSDGGTLVLAVPNDLQPVRNWLKLLLKRLGSRRFKPYGRSGLPKIALDGSLEQVHLSHFTHSVLRRLLESSGFRVVQEGIDPFYSANGLKRLIINVYYGICSFVWSALRLDLYTAIWIVGKKVAPRSSVDISDAKGG